MQSRSAGGSLPLMSTTSPLGRFARLAVAISGAMAALGGGYSLFTWVNAEGSSGFGVLVFALGFLGLTIPTAAALRLQMSRRLGTTETATPPAQYAALGVAAGTVVAVLLVPILVVSWLVMSAFMGGWPF